MTSRAAVNARGPVSLFVVSVTGAALPLVMAWLAVQSLAP